MNVLCDIGWAGDVSDGRNHALDDRDETTLPSFSVFYCIGHPSDRMADHRNNQEKTKYTRNLLSLKRSNRYILQRLFFSIHSIWPTCLPFSLSRSPQSRNSPTRRRSYFSLFSREQHTDGKVCVQFVCIVNCRRESFSSFDEACADFSATLHRTFERARYRKNNHQTEVFFESQVLASSIISIRTHEWWLFIGMCRSSSPMLF